MRIMTENVRDGESKGGGLLKVPIPHKVSNNKNLRGWVYYRGGHPLVALAMPVAAQNIYLDLSQRRYSRMSIDTGTGGMGEVG